MILDGMFELFALIKTKVKKVFASKEPKAKLGYSNGKLEIQSYNKAFVDDLRHKHGDVVSPAMSDAEVVKLFLERENVTFEEPKLECLHSGITEDGHIQMKLDWNQAFIKMLRENGIEGETEEDMIETYLMLIGREAADSDDLRSTLDPTEAFREMDEIRAVELEEAAKKIEESQRKNRQTKQRNKRDVLERGRQADLALKQAKRDAGKQ